MSYEDMYELICSAKPPVAKMFSNELLIAIFWEESLFNNIEQTGGGTAWGFGQVEPAEMYRCEDQTATDRGYGVAGLPKPVKMGKVTRLGGKLTPEQSVQVAIGVLCSIHFSKNGNREAALRAYGGVGYTGTDVPARLIVPGSREAIIQGWKQCEAHLQNRPLSYGSDFPTYVKEGLNKARPFNLNDPHIDDILFPKWFVTTGGARIWRPQRTPKWLLDTMKAG
jgi:hypothetical protein